MEFLSRMSHFMPIVDKIQLLLTVLSIMVARGKININQNISIYGRWQMESFMSTCVHLCSLCSLCSPVFTCVHSRGFFCDVCVVHHFSFLYCFVCIRSISFSQCCLFLLIFQCAVLVVIVWLLDLPVQL